MVTKKPPESMSPGVSFGYLMRSLSVGLSHFLARSQGVDRSCIQVLLPCMAPFPLLCYRGIWVDQLSWYSLTVCLDLPSRYSLAARLDQLVWYSLSICLDQRSWYSFILGLTFSPKVNSGGLVRPLGMVLSGFLARSRDMVLSGFLARSVVVVLSSLVSRSANTALV